MTILYNLLEGGVSVFFGIADETLALFGFGVDSFVEVLSGIGIWHMLRRLRHAGTESPDRFERDALRVTGTAFYLLAAGLVATAGYTIISGSRPETTFWGIVVSLVSIFSMWLLVRLKMDAGRALRSDALVADARCTRACMQLSFVLLAASAGYELTGFAGLDAAGAIFIAVLSYREGREAFEKSRGVLACSCA